MRMRIKICGITRLDQAQAITQLGISTLGFIGVPRSPRYISANRIQEIVAALPPEVRTIGVFVDESVDAIAQHVHHSGLTGVQLHGSESPQMCQELRQVLPSTEIIKAFRIRTAADLEQTQNYTHHHAAVDTLLLDAYHPQMQGGTGLTLDWSMLKAFAPSQPWLLAGGLHPDNVAQALATVSPAGVDLSSGVERSPGDKDLQQIQALLTHIQTPQIPNSPTPRPRHP